MNPAIIDALKREIAALVDAYPELAEDQDLRADMIEGETDFNRVASRLVGVAIESSAYAEAVKAIQLEYGERRSRYEAQERRARATLATLMEIADIRKLALPVATVSLKEPQPVAVVDDVEALPQGFFKTERKPLKTEIKAALMAGESVPGAALALGEASLIVRVK